MRTPEWEACLLLREELIPQPWRDRAVTGLAVVPLLPDEASRLLGGEATAPGIDPEDEQLAKLLARGHSTDRIATELGVSNRSAERRIARLRRRFQLGSKADLAVHLARRGFR